MHITNLSNEEVELVVMDVEMAGNNAISISSFSRSDLGVLKLLESVEFTVSFIPKFTGIQKIGGILIHDKRSSKEWIIKEYEEIFVENKE